MTFRRTAALVLALGLFTAACGSDSGGGSNGAIGSTPDAERVDGLTFATFDGAIQRFDDRIGTPMVVNFFAEWCVNCIHEMPDLEIVSQELAGEVDFLGISIDRGSAEALALVEATGVTYDIGWDPSAELDADGLRDLIAQEVL